MGMSDGSSGNVGKYLRGSRCSSILVTPFKMCSLSFSAGTSSDLPVTSNSNNSSFDPNMTGKFSSVLLPMLALRIALIAVIYSRVLGARSVTGKKSKNGL